MAIFVTAVLVLLYAGWALWWRRGGSAGGTLGPGLGRAMKLKRKACSWSETGGSKGRFVEYRCATCDVVAMSYTGKAPQDCKKVIAD